MPIKNDQILTWLDQQSEAMLALLEELVNIDSWSYDKIGIDAVATRLIAFFKEHDIAYQTQALSTSGDIVVGSVLPKKGNQNYLLMGHRDTVFPTGEVAKRGFSKDGDKAYGPGVADMKAGLVMNAFLMAAFRQFSPLTPLVMMATGDEEIGSPQSRPYIENEAKQAIAAFNAEPARISGNIVVARKGGMTYKFLITGKAAHSGVNYAEGINAIEEFSHKVVALSRLTDLANGATVSVNMVKGGQSSNTIAPSCEGQIDVRFATLDQRADLTGQIEHILTTSYVEGTTTSFEKNTGFLPLDPGPEDRKLAQQYFHSARELGMDIGGEYTGGAADSGFAAFVGCPTICGVGPVGGGAHTAEEYIDIHTMVERAKVVALTILSLEKEKLNP